MGGGDMHQTGNHPAGHDHQDQAHHHPCFLDHPLMGDHQHSRSHEHHAHFLGGGGRGHPPHHYFGGRDRGCGGRGGGRGHMRRPHYNDQFDGPWGYVPLIADPDLGGPSFGPIHTTLTPFIMMRDDHGHYRHLHRRIGGPFGSHPYAGHHHLHRGQYRGHSHGCHGCSSTTARPCNEANDQVRAEGREANANVGTPIVAAN